MEGDGLAVVSSKVTGNSFTNKLALFLGSKLPVNALLGHPSRLGSDCHI